MGFFSKGMDKGKPAGHWEKPKQEMHPAVKRDLDAIQRQYEQNKKKGKKK